MTYSEIYLYSPLSVQTVKEKQNPALLLQFILSEIFHALDADKKEDPLEFVFSSPACFFPFDWSYEVGCLNKMSEHSELLFHAFPEMESQAIKFKGVLQEILAKVLKQKKLKKHFPKKELLKDLHKIYLELDPFLIACKDNENLVSFLKKNHPEIEELTGKSDFLSTLLCLTV